MLPKLAHKDDQKWVREQMAKVPFVRRAKAARGYDEVWQAAHDAEPKPHCKENAGRFAANCRLREYIAKVHASMQR